MLMPGIAQIPDGYDFRLVRGLQKGTIRIPPLGAHGEIETIPLVEKGGVAKPTHGLRWALAAPATKIQTRFEPAPAASVGDDCAAKPQRPTSHFCSPASSLEFIAQVVHGKVDTR